MWLVNGNLISGPSPAVARPEAPDDPVLGLCSHRVPFEFKSVHRLRANVADHWIWGHCPRDQSRPSIRKIFYRNLPLQCSSKRFGLFDRGKSGFTVRLRSRARKRHATFCTQGRSLIYRLKCPLLTAGRAIVALRGAQCVGKAPNGPVKGCASAGKHLCDHGPPLDVAYVARADRMGYLRHRREFPWRAPSRLWT